VSLPRFLPQFSDDHNSRLINFQMLVLCQVSTGFQKILDALEKCITDVAIENAMGYQALREVDTVQATIREYKKLGEKDKLKEYQQEHADELKVAKRLDRTQKMVGKINQQIKLVHMSQTMDADEKRSRIDSLLNHRQMLFEQGIKNLF
jgi:hypothetical protein